VYSLKEERFLRTFRYGSSTIVLYGPGVRIRAIWGHLPKTRLGFFCYGKRGRISVADLQAQRNTCSCLTLIIACIIYWQAKEIAQIIDAYGHELDEKFLMMLPHISPIGWNNIILYGEYVLDRSLIK